MSTGASGDIVSVPIAAIVILPVAAGAAAAVAAAAVVTAIAGVGAVAVRETGKAVIACGRELMTMAAENMATHRLLFEAASQHEARLAAAELQADEQRAGSVADYVARQRRHMADHAATLARLRESLKSPPPAVTIDWTAIHAAQERVAGASSAPAKAERASPRDWGLRIDAALRWAGLIENGFSMLDSGPNKGLFNLTGVRELLQDQQALLGKLDAGRGLVIDRQAPAPVADLEESLGTLAYLARRLGELQNAMPRQQAQRREALESLEQAHRSLEQALSVGHPQGAGGLPIAAKMLDDSAAAFAQSNFSAAASLAQAVSQHLADLQSLAAAQRRRNCRLILDRLRRDVEPLAALPQLNQEVVDWIAAWQACSGRAETDLDHAWAGLRRLEERATRLHESALRALVSAGQTASLDQAGAVLQEMGFGQETSSETDDVRAITASRGTQRARVSCAPNGHATVEFTGFGDSSCAQAMQEFTRRMAARDVQGVWQARFSLTHATQQLVRLLTGAGLDVKVEPSDEGATIIAAGTARSSVTFDGQARLSPEMRQLYADQWERFVRAPEAAPATDQHALLDLELEDLRQKAFNDMQEQFLLKVRA